LVGVAGQVTVAREDGTPLCDRCSLADTPAGRLKGLLGRTGLERGEGLLLKPAPAIHTFFMRFPIDALFLDSEMRVVRVVSHMRPWRAAMCRGARSVVELPAGEAARLGVVVGDHLELDGRGS
jgi:uncharacterized membrane protein (UPF0127 family)